jgi:hypothetical protein
VLFVRCITKANSKTDTLFWSSSTLHAKVIPSAQEGKANKRLVELLAKKLGISRTRIKIIKGKTSRYKTIQLDIDSVRFDDFIRSLSDVRD